MLWFLFLLMDAALHAEGSTIASAKVLRGERLSLEHDSVGHDRERRATVRRDPATREDERLELTEFH